MEQHHVHPRAVLELGDGAEHLADGDVEPVLRRVLVVVVLLDAGRAHRSALVDDEHDAVALDGDPVEARLGAADVLLGERRDVLRNLEALLVLRPPAGPDLRVVVEVHPREAEEGLGDGVAYALFFLDLESLDQRRDRRARTELVERFDGSKAHLPGVVGEVRDDLRDHGVVA